MIIVNDQSFRNIYNAICTAVIFVQYDIFLNTISLLKCKDILSITSTELIYCLIIITYYTQVCPCLLYTSDAADEL